MRHCRTLSQKAVYGAKMENIRKKLMRKTVKQLEQLFSITEESDIRKQISKVRHIKMMTELENFEARLWTICHITILVDKFGHYHDHHFATTRNIFFYIWWSNSIIYWNISSMRKARGKKGGEDRNETEENNVISTSYIKIQQRIFSRT